MDTRNLDGILLHWPAVCVVIGGRKYAAQTDHFEDEDLCMEIRLEKQGRVWRKHLEVRAKRPLPTPDYVEMDRQTVPDPAMRQCGYLDTGGQVRREGAGEEGGGVIPGCGYPLIGRKIFTGLAHQAGFARIESQDSVSTTYSLRHHPVWNGDRLESIEAVFCVSDKPEKDFAEYIKENFLERLEIHHRTSVSADPTQQNNIDNLDTLNTTQHDVKHTDSNGNINYRKKLTEPLLDRKSELQDISRRQVLYKRLTGLGASVAIGLGTAFTIGFLVSLAQNGISPNSLKYAFVSGAKQGASGAGMAAAGYTIGSTIGAAAGKTLTSVISTHLGTNIAEKTLKKISEFCNMGAAGALVTIAFSVYQFAKLKYAGYTTKECLLRTGKSAALSLSILTISMIAVWAGCPGIAVSIVTGVIMTGYYVAKVHCDKRVSRSIAFYSIELCKPHFCMA